jgi:azurin
MDRGQSRRVEIVARVSNSPGISTPKPRPTPPLRRGSAKISRPERAISDVQTLICVIAHPPGLCESPRVMNKMSLAILSLGLVLLAGCGKQDSAAAAAPSATPSGSVFELTANDAMKFSVTRFEAKAGTDLKVVLTNLGSMPKAAMGHNWVLLKKGVDGKAFADASATAAATDYIPPSPLGDQIIAHTKMLGPKQTDEITFKVPTEPGEYTFLCTFPAHYVSGMHGILVVK